MFSYLMSILRSINVTIIVVNFTEDEKRSFVTEAHHVQVVVIVAYPRKSGGSEVNFLHFLKQLPFVCLKF
jgi:hypothetical protein